jgi:hypothetical protein
MINAPCGTGSGRCVAAAARRAEGGRAGTRPLCCYEVVCAHEVKRTFQRPLLCMPPLMPLAVSTSSELRCCNAPHLSSGGELSAVAGVVFPFKLSGWLVAQG